MAVDRHYDLVVIGGGAAGMSAARTGVERGGRVLLVQEGPIGGDCTFTGCVPSKTLLESAHVGLGFDAAMQRVRDAVARVAATEDDEVFEQEGIEVRHAVAAFTSPTQVDLDGVRVTAKAFVVATGAAPRRPDIGLHRVRHHTTDDIWALQTQPASLVIIGGGPVGCELAEAFAALGTNVTMVHSHDRLLADHEPEASAVVQRSLATRGVDMVLGSRAASVREEGGRIFVVNESGASAAGDVLLVATGRTPTVDRLGLDRISVEVTGRGIVTDKRLRTTVAGIHAAGDVTGRAPYTHAADEMGRIAASNALGRLAWRRFDERTIPSVTFTSPEVARIGMTEAAAAELDMGARVAELPLDDVDRAIAADQTDGFVKLIAAPRPLTRNIAGGHLVGATIVAPRAGEMIHEVVVAMRAGMFTGRLAQAVHAYPTWSIAVRQAAAQFFTEVNGRTARPARR
ncbi:MAG TPA: FAD-dependent oxidoreductase [Acidimicrobiales bacterium]|nr:FAD-dependent oxidoreductase [Acidimicrobiales bacterium]